MEYTTDFYHVQISKKAVFKFFFKKLFDFNLSSTTFAVRFAHGPFV